MLREKCHSLEWPLTSYTSKVRFSDEYYEELPDGHENVVKDYLLLLSNSGDSMTKHGSSLDSKTSSDYASSHSLQVPEQNENDDLGKTTSPQIGEPPSKKIRETIPKGSNRSAPLKRANKV